MTRALPSGSALFISVRPSRRPSHKKKNHRHNRQHQPFQTAKARQKASQAFRPDRRFLSLSAQANIQAIKKEPPAVLFHYINFRKATWQKCIFSELFLNCQSTDFLLWQKPTTYKLYKNDRYCQVIGVGQTFRKLGKHVHLQCFIRPVDFSEGQIWAKTGQNAWRNKRR